MESLKRVTLLPIVSFAGESTEHDWMVNVKREEDADLLNALAVGLPDVRMMVAPEVNFDVLYAEERVEHGEEVAPHEEAVDPEGST